ncbi:MAG TPA: hypothetical protein VN452_07155 [Longilinea sp.]|nr:hypothetical protein [Longilinea sp.]
MEEDSRNDIRRLLKTFGVKADDEIMRHFLRNQTSSPLHLRITLDDLTDYGNQPPKEPLHIVVEGDIHR